MSASDEAALAQAGRARGVAVSIKMAWGKRAGANALRRNIARRAMMPKSPRLATHLVVLGEQQKCRRQRDLPSIGAKLYAAKHAGSMAAVS